MSVQARVLELFAEVNQFGFAALFISHDLAVVDTVSDRIAVLYRGERWRRASLAGAGSAAASVHPATSGVAARAGSGRAGGSP